MKTIVNNFIDYAIDQAAGQKTHEANVKYVRLHSAGQVSLGADYTWSRSFVADFYKDTDEIVIFYDANILLNGQVMTILGINIDQAAASGSGFIIRAIYDLTNDTMIAVKEDIGAKT